jgi:tRNA 2-thiouridine synthesizing protein A
MTHVLDVRDLVCPLPVLRANKRMRTLDPGEILEVLVTDRSAVQDFEIYCQRTRNELLDWDEVGGIFRFRIRKFGKCISK